MACASRSVVIVSLARCLLMSTCVFSQYETGHDDGEDGRRALDRLSERHGHVLQTNQSQHHRGEPDTHTHRHTGGVGGGGEEVRPLHQ